MGRKYVADTMTQKCIPLAAILGLAAHAAVIGSGIVGGYQSADVVEFRYPISAVSAIDDIVLCAGCVEGGGGRHDCYGCCGARSDR